MSLASLRRVVEKGRELKKLARTRLKELEQVV